MPYGGGDAERFRARALGGPELEQCRDALEAEGHSFMSPERALVRRDFCFGSVRDALVGVELQLFQGRLQQLETLD